MASGIRNISCSTKKILMYCPDNLASLYVKDKIRDMSGANSSSMLDVNNKSTFMSAMDMCQVAPMIAESWVFILHYDKVSKLMYANKAVFDSSYAYFIIEVKNYKEFLDVKKNISVDLELYLSYIGFYDVEYLFRGFKIHEKIINFIAKSYRDSPESIFTLLKWVQEGAKLEERSDVVDLIGKPTGTVSSFAIMLLEDSKKVYTEKLFSNRLNTIQDLCGIYGFSSLRNFLMASVKDILDIKILWLVGTIYDKIWDLPEGYDTKRLSRYNRLLPVIIGLPYEKILNLYMMLNSCYWRTDIDMLNFMYKYYKKGLR